MPRSKNFLPDVNVWLALASSHHVHAGSAAAWLDGVTSGEAAFCRVTQMGLLRLLTNPKVMGADVLNQPAAWRVYDRMRSDVRVGFAVEPPGLEKVWRAETRSARAGSPAAGPTPTCSLSPVPASCASFRLIKVSVIGEMRKRSS